MFSLLFLILNTSVAGTCDWSEPTHINTDSATGFPIEVVSASPLIYHPDHNKWYLFAAIKHSVAVDSGTNPQHECFGGTFADPGNTVGIHAFSADDIDGTWNLERDLWVPFYHYNPFFSTPSTLPDAYFAISCGVTAIDAKITPSGDFRIFVAGEQLPSTSSLAPASPHSWGSETESAIFSFKAKVTSAGVMKKLSNPFLISDINEYTDGVTVAQNDSTGETEAYWEVGGDIVKSTNVTGTSWTGSTTSVVLSPGLVSWREDGLFSPSAVCSPDGNIDLVTSGFTSSGSVRDEVGFSLGYEAGTSWTLEPGSMWWSDVATEEYVDASFSKIGTVGQEFLATYVHDGEVYSRQTRDFIPSELQYPDCEAPDFCWQDFAVNHNAELPMGLDIYGRYQLPQPGTGSFQLNHGTLGTDPLVEIEGDEWDAGEAFCGIDECGDILCASETASISAVTVLPTGGPYSNLWMDEHSGYQNGCALDVDGQIDCWGDDGESVVTSEPTALGYTDLSISRRAVCAVASDSSIDCWGNSTFINSGAPTTGSYERVSCDQEYCVSVKTDGTLFVWASVSATGMSTLAPTASNFVDVEAFEDGLAAGAIDSDGYLVMWDASTTSTPWQIAQRVDGDATIAQLEQDEDRVCVMIDDPGTTSYDHGDVVCWGDLSVAPITRFNAEDGCP